MNERMPERKRMARYETKFIPTESIKTANEVRTVEGNVP